MRAYDKHTLLPDGLLGAAAVAVHDLGDVADATVAGSGGGREVQARFCPLLLSPASARLLPCACSRM